MIPKSIFGREIKNDNLPKLIAPIGSHKNTALDLNTTEVQLLKTLKEKALSWLTIK